MLVDGKITSGHARALLAIEDNELQIKIAEKIVEEGLNVRDVERLVKSLAKPKKEKEKTREDESLTVISRILKTE